MVIGKRLIAFFAAIVIALVFSSGLYASLDRGTIQGVVSDQQGAVVPGASVTVTNLGTNVAVKLKTNSVGFYLATQLVPGKYAVHVEAKGFKAFDLTNVIVTAGRCPMGRWR